MFDRAAKMKECRNRYYVRGKFLLVSLILLLCGISYAPIVAADAPPLEAAMISLDHQLFPFIYLSVAVNRYGEGISTLTKSNFQVTENGVLQTDYFDVIPPQAGGGVRLVDIVFLMDNSGSMIQEQNAVRDNVIKFVNDLAASDVDYALGLCRFGATQNGGNPIIEDNGTLTTDPEYFKNTLWNRNVVNGGHEPGWDALYEAANGFAFRPGSQKVFILITDECVTHPGDTNYGDYSYNDALNALEDRSVTAFALIDLDYTNSIEDYGTIAEATNGQYFDIYSPLDDILGYISSQVANTYRITYKSSNPAFDGIERHVVVTVSYQGDQATCDDKYTPGSAPRIQRTQDTLALHDQSWAAGTTFAIKAEITDDVTPYVQSATLYYRTTGDATYVSTPMTHSSDIWTGTILGGAVKTPGLDYYISATDGQSTTTDPPAPTTDPPVDPTPHQLAILPNIAPQITHTPVTTAMANTPVTITAEVVDTTNALDSIELWYRKVGQLIFKTNGQMANIGGDTYQDTIPSSYVTEAGVEYCILAYDDLGIGNWHGSFFDPHVITVLSNQPPNTTIETADIDSANRTAKFTWSGSDDTTPPAQLVYEYRLLNPDSPLYDWSGWSSEKTKTYTNLPSGRYKFEVHAKDADEAVDPSPASREFTIGEAAQGTITGRVTDASIPGPSNGIVGAVLLLDPDPLTYCPTTDANGYFSFSIPADTYNITASAEGYVSEAKTGITVVAGETTELNFALGPASIVWVEVNRDGTYIYQDREGSPDLSKKLKRLPAGWVLQRITENGKPIERSPDGGIRWFHKVEDVTDSTVGWVERGGLDEGGDQALTAPILAGKATHSALFQAHLERGDDGSEVRKLQLLLKQEVGAPEYPDSVQATAFFGSVTETALKAFQEDHGLELTGELDAATRQKVNALLNDGGYQLQLTRADAVEQLLRQLVSDPPVWVSKTLRDFLSAASGEESSDVLGLLLAVAAAESGGDDFDNSMVAFNEWGRGIMQLDSNYYVGSGSMIVGYLDGKEDFARCRDNYPACSCYYTNTMQGIEANVRDGFHALGDKYSFALNSCDQQSLNERIEDSDLEEMSCADLRLMAAIRLYQGSDEYLDLIRNRVRDLSDFFTYDQAALKALADEWVPKLNFLISNPEIRYELGSEATFRVSDSSGRTTGSTVEGARSEIPFSCFDAAASKILILLASDTYECMVIGTSEGRYDLGVTFSQDEKRTSFVASGIPTSLGSQHQYSIDWDALARGEKGVTLQVDNDGDGTFEKTIHAGSTLDGTTTPIANQPPDVSILAPVEEETITESSYRVKWEATDPDGAASDLSIDIELSSNGKASWTTLASNEENDGLCEWDLSGTIGGQYFLKITATDPHEASSEAVVGPFTVSRFEWNVIVAPNPVTSAGTAFFYTLPEGTSTAKLMIFGASGRLVFETPLDEDSSRFPDAGTWNPVDQDGIPLANGPYIYVLIGDDKVIGQGKMVIQR